DPAVLHALVLAAVALVVLHWAKDLRAEEAVPLRLERPVVDRLRLLHLAVRPLPDLLRGGERDANRRKRHRILRLLEEIEDVLHLASVLVRTVWMRLFKVCLFAAQLAGAGGRRRRSGGRRRGAGLGGHLACHQLEGRLLLARGVRILDELDVETE